MLVRKKIPVVVVSAIPDQAICHQPIKATSPFIPHYTFLPHSDAQFELHAYAHVYMAECTGFLPCYWVITLKVCKNKQVNSFI